jgi:hypothetical protein
MQNKASWRSVPCKRAINYIVRCGHSNGMVTVISRITVAPILVRDTCFSVQWLRILPTDSRHRPVSVTVVPVLSSWVLNYLFLGFWVGRPRGRSSSPGRMKKFHFSASSRPAEAHPVYPMSTGGSDHSPPTNAEVKKMWIYTQLPNTPSWCSA